MIFFLLESFKMGGRFKHLFEKPFECAASVIAFIFLTVFYFFFIISADVICKVPKSRYGILSARSGLHLAPGFHFIS